MCEGGRREPDYFNYFSGIDSRVRIIAIQAENGSNNSPTGLLDSAKKLTGIDGNFEDAPYQITEGDELWFVIDTDRWAEHIKSLKEAIQDKSSWYVAQSNPCFELWLYYHFSFEKPSFPGMSKSSNWKRFLNDFENGGFNSKKHPLLISTAIKNSEYHDNGKESPEFLVTHVYKLGKSIYALLSKKIDSARNKLKI